MYDLKIVGGTLVDGSGKDRYTGDVGIKDGKIVDVGKCDDSAAETIDAERRHRGSRLRRHPHALRRADQLGRRARSLVDSRGHHLRDGKLRSWFRAGSADRPRQAGRADGRRRRHPWHCSLGRDQLGVGELPGLHGRPRSHAAHDRLPRTRSPRCPSCVRDGPSARRTTKLQPPKTSRRCGDCCARLSKRARSASAPAGATTTGAPSATGLRHRKRPARSSPGSRKPSED